MPIAVNLSKCEKALCFLCKDKKTPNGSFYKDEWFLYSNVSTYFTLFESDFISMTLGTCGSVNTANSKASLFIVNSNIILIKHEIFSPKKETTKVAVSKLWLVNCVSGMQMYFFPLDKLFSLN